ncbi:acyl-CoA dehydrogenase [Ectothiorhodospiraceae bacterium BW-2]|nr:acyl-CoA dehydrogenase [Ectothiorhodospiraceae bacterium BW-2]
MDMALTEQQRASQQAFRQWVETHVEPVADEHDSAQRTPQSMIDAMAAEGYLGALIDSEYGGGSMDAVSWGLLCEEFGRGSASLLSLLTVHGMVLQSIAKWGTEAQKANWLPKLASGAAVGAFGLTEPNVGSDAKSIESVAVEQADGSFLLNAEKRWISFGDSANLILIIAKVDDKPAAFLVQSNMAGFSREPITGMLGFRAANIAKLVMKDVVVPAENLLGRVGFGFSHIANTALDHGRYCVGWGCVGLAQAALDASMAYAGERRQFGEALNKHQLIQQLLADMVVDIKAARMLNYHAAYLKDIGEPSLIMETSMAKYFASRVAVKATDSAVQIHGANGCSSDYPVQRFYRDAKIMEIIEGSNQMQQIIIAKSGYQQHLVAKRAARRAKQPQE